MTPRSSTPLLQDGSNGLSIFGHSLVYPEGMLPEDFAHRLDLLKEATGLSWKRFAEVPGVDPKQALRWKGGTELCGGAMLSIVCLGGRSPEVST